MAQLCQKEAATRITADGLRCSIQIPGAELDESIRGRNELAATGLVLRRAGSPPIPRCRALEPPPVFVRWSGEWSCPVAHPGAAIPFLAAVVFSSRKRGPGRIPPLPAAAGVFAQQSAAIAQFPTFTHKGRRNDSPVSLLMLECSPTFWGRPGGHMIAKAISPAPNAGGWTTSTGSRASLR